MITPRIQILIQEETEFGQFNDALYLEPEEYLEMSEEEIKAKAQERIDSYIASRKDLRDNPPEPIKETDEELENRKKELMKEVAEIDMKLNED